MNRSEAARILGVGEDTLARWVRQGLLRSLDRRGRRFDREELVRWARDRGIRVDSDSAAPTGKQESALLAAIARGAVTTGAQPESAAAAIRVAIDALVQLDEDLRARLLDEVLERERMASTGLGEGIAVPHPREPLGRRLEKPLVSLVLLERRLDWAAVDGEPVHTVALLAAPTAAAHLEILSALGRAVRSREVVRLLCSRPERSALVGALRPLLEDVGA